MGNRYKRRIRAAQRRNHTGKNQESAHVQLLRSQFQEIFKNVTDYFSGACGMLAQQIGAIGLSHESTIEILDSHIPGFKTELELLVKEKKEAWEAKQKAKQEAADKARAEAAEALKQNPLPSPVCDKCGTTLTPDNIEHHGPACQELPASAYVSVDDPRLGVEPEGTVDVKAPQSERPSQSDTQVEQDTGE